MGELELAPKDFTLKRRLAIASSHGVLSMHGLEDGSETPCDFLRAASLVQGDESFSIRTEFKRESDQWVCPLPERFKKSLTIELSFFGHYNEPDLSFKCPEAIKNGRQEVL